MSRSLVRLVPVLILASLALSACNDDDSNKNNDLVVGKSAPEQCEYQYLDGDSAIMSYASRTNYIDSGIFGKRYNRYDLEAILGASGAETVKYAEAIDIYLRRIPYNGKKDRCLYEEQMEVAPNDLIEYWKNSQNGRLNNGEAGVDGFYKKHLVDGKIVQLILVRTSSQRWTLVHELMHANFASTREALGQPENYADQINSSATLVEQYLGDYYANKSEQNLTLAAQAVRSLEVALRGTLINYALEEVANESILVDEYVAGRLKNVTRSSLLNAAWYINCSRERAFESLNSIASLTRAQILIPAQSNGWIEAQTLAQQTLSEISALDARARELGTRAKTLSGISDEDLECDLKNADVRARISQENPHLDYMLNTNPSMIAFKKAMRNLNYAGSQRRQ